MSKMIQAQDRAECNPGIKYVGWHCSKEWKEFGAGPTVREAPQRRHFKG